MGLYGLEVTCLLAIGYGFLFLRIVKGAHLPVWEGAVISFLVCLALGYLLEAFGIPLKKTEKVSKGFAPSQWPAPNRRYFLRLSLTGFGLSALLCLLGALTGK